MSNIEIYGIDIASGRFVGKVCPIMSGIGPMCSGSSWIGCPCLKEKCMLFKDGVCSFYKAGAP